MALFKQRNGTVGISNMILKVLPSKILRSSTGIVTKPSPRGGGGGTPILGHIRDVQPE